MDTVNDQEKSNTELLKEVAALRHELEVAKAQSLQWVMDYLPQAIFWKDRASVYLGANRNFLRDAGFPSPAELIGKSDYDLPWTAAETEFYRQVDREVMEADTAQINFEESITKADGTAFWIRTSKIPMHDAAGNVVAILGLYEDITARKQAEVEAKSQLEAALRDSNKRITSIIEALPDIVFVFDEEGRYIEILTARDNLLYAPLMELKGRLMSEVLPPAAVDLFMGVIRQTLATGQLQIIEYPLETQSSGLQWFEGRVKSLEGAVTEKQAVVFVSRDITERKQAEAEREHLHQELLEAQQRAIVELSTPIIPIMEGIIILPLVGSIDSVRAREITRALLAGISRERAKIVILDITGVSVVDSGVASHLDKTIQAARLKGAQTIITGISDAVAETIVDLGINWSRLETVSNLQTGLAVAVAKLRS
jgi:rsbT co-antagonist protein RsbR